MEAVINPLELKLPATRPDGRFFGDAWVPGTLVDFP